MSERVFTQPPASPAPDPEEASPPAPIATGPVPMSLFPSAHSVEPEEEISVKRFISLTRGGQWRAKVESVHAAAKAGNKAAVSALKRKLPAVSVSSLMESRAKDAPVRILKHTGLLQADFDAKDNPDMAPSTRQMLQHDPHVEAVFTGPSGAGIKCFVRIDPERHPESVETAIEYFRGKYRLVMDKACKDPERLCFASWDPAAWCRPNSAAPAVPLPIPDRKPEPTRRRVETHNDTAGGGGSSDSRPEIGADEIRKMLTVLPARPEYETWLKIASAVFNSGLSLAEAVRLLNEWSPEEKTGEYEAKWKNRLEKVGVGTLIRMAREHGYALPLRPAGKVILGSSANGAGRAAESSNGGDEDGGEDTVPKGIFPVPANEIGYNTAGERIFSVIGKTRRMFMRGGVAHEVVKAGKEPAHLAPVQTPRFCAMLETFGHRVARREESKDAVRWRSDTMPEKSARVLLASDPAMRHLPEIRQLVSCPVLTPEGEVLGAGYHAHAGGTFITQGEAPPEVPLETAVNALAGLLKDFAFTTPADTSRAVASLVSPALKMGGWIDDDFPLDLAEADQSQSGKTHRLKLVNTLYNEQATTIMEPKGGVGSLDEAVSAALIKGRPFVLLDNFRGKLDSAILESAIRGAGRVTCRALRTSAEVDTTPFLWQLSTNGAELTRDIANRSIITRIRKQPDGHVFYPWPEGSLLKHVAANRPFYLGCVFSVLRAWRDAGRPKTSESRHDFRLWCRSLDWIVQRLFGLPPLLDGHREEQARTANPALQWLRDICMAVKLSNLLDRELSASEVADIAEDSGIEFPGNASAREDANARVGKILGRLYKETDGEPIRVDGFTVIRGEEERYNPENRMTKKYKFYTVRHELNQ